MAPLSGGPARTLPAKWHRYSDARLYTVTCLKIEGKQIFSYDIYGFAINRIYKKKLQYVYLGFFGEVKVVDKLFFECENKSRCE